MFRKCRFTFTIMERYRQIRPGFASVKPNIDPPPDVKPPPVLSSYIRSPVPISAKSFVAPGRVVQPMNPKRLRVALVGAPNAGKTMLLNQILKSQVGAVSSKSNTTRESIVGVLTRGDVQIEFVDCPGIVPINQSVECQSLSAIAWQTFGDCDCALFVVDTVKKPIFEFLKIIRKIAPIRSISDELNAFHHGDNTSEQLAKPVILVLNKSDLVEERKWLKIRNLQLSSHGNFESVFYVSAKKNTGIDRLVNALLLKATPGEWQYDQSVVTTLSMTDQIAQLCRSFLFTWFNKDVPYAISQQTVGWTERLDGTLVIEHELIVKDSIVARMILGTNGKLQTRMIDTVVHKLKTKWNLEKIRLLIHVKAQKQRISKRDKLLNSQKINSHSFFSRGRGT